MTNGANTGGYGSGTSGSGQTGSGQTGGVGAMGVMADSPVEDSPQDVALSREQLLELRILHMESQAAQKRFSHAIELYMARLGVDPETHGLNMQTGRFEAK